MVELRPLSHSQLQAQTLQHIRKQSQVLFYGALLAPHSLHKRATALFGLWVVLAELVALREPSLALIKLAFWLDCIDGNHPSSPPILAMLRYAGIDPAETRLLFEQMPPVLRSEISPEEAARTMLGSVFSRLSSHAGEHQEAMLALGTALQLCSVFPKAAEAVINPYPGWGHTKQRWLRFLWMWLEKAIAGQRHDHHDIRMHDRIRALF